jgi:putative ABC transport system permease protein
MDGLKGSSIGGIAWLTHGGSNVDNIFAAFAAAFRRMTRRPLRSILTVLEVALGALAVTVALNLTQGRQLAALPPNVFRVIFGDRSDNSFSSYPLFKNGDLEQLRKLIPDAEAVEIYSRPWTSLLEYKGERYKLIGSAQVTPDHLKVSPLEILQGAFFSSKDVEMGTNPVVISQGIAKQLFRDENPLGKNLQFSLGITEPGSSPTFQTYRVSGVFRDPTDTQSPTEFAYFPFKESSESADVVALEIKAKPGQIKIAQAQALEAVRRVYKDDYWFKVSKGSVFTTSSTNIFQDAPSLDPQALLFSAFAIIMLITCSIGIFSIQLVDITERTKEIGMRRALGATRSMIVLESLASAFVLAGLGAVIGVLIAAPLLPVIKNATGPLLFSRGLEFSPIVALEVVAIVLVVGVMLGFYPALLASRLRPVEALREM